MYMITDRISSLREKALQWEKTQTGYIGQRMYYAFEGLVAAGKDEPWMKKKSRMLANIIQRSEVIYHEDELIAGYNYYGEETGMWNEFLLREINEEDKRMLVNYLNKGRLTEAQIRFILDILEGIGQYVPMVPFSLQQPVECLAAEQEGIIWAYGISENHTIVGYEEVLKKGFSGIRNEIKQQIDHLTWDDPESPIKRLLLESTFLVADSASMVGTRYRLEVEKLRDACTGLPRREELSNIIKVLEQVPEYPARTFHEAIQSLWFAHIINTWEDGINANSLGRLDQILYPYYRKDMDEGRLTRQEAFELICCLWIKLYRDYDVQQVVLGGVNAKGEDAANELTYLMLDATEALDFIRCLSVRLHKNSPMKLLRRSLEIVAKGKGIPFFFNDDIVIPALTGSGIDLEDARDYGAIGCIEVTIPGKANPHAVSNRINLLKGLELALNNGVSMTTGKQVGLKTGEISEMKSMEDILHAYEKQVEYFIGMACFESNRIELANGYIKPMPYKSILTEGCLASGKDFNHGGAKYNFHESMGMGIPNVADSLAALQKLVFEEGKYTLQEVADHLCRNFPDEAVRLEFLKRAPKFGNDDDYVDKYAERVMAHFCKTVKALKSSSGLGFFAQPFTFIWLVEAGEKTAATPDGRRNGENLAYSLSPMQGRDNTGLTALLNSIAKLPCVLAAGGCSSIIEVDPLLFNEKNLELMAILLKSAIEKGVGQIQFNVVNADTLRKAQAEPEKYQNLAVRVSGFSQRFCLLDRKLQDHIIARTKHKNA